METIKTPAGTVICSTPPVMFPWSVEPSSAVMVQVWSASGLPSESVKVQLTGRSGPETEACALTT